MLVMYFIVRFVFIQQISKSNQLSLTTFFLAYFSLFHFRSPFHCHCFCLLLFYCAMSSDVFCFIQIFSIYSSSPWGRKKPNWLNSYNSMPKTRGLNVRYALECSLRRLCILAATKLTHGELNQVSLDYCYSRTPCFPGNWRPRLSTWKFWLQSVQLPPQSATYLGWNSSHQQVISLTCSISRLVWSPFNQ